MDADSNPASGMNCLQQSQFEKRSLFGCRRQRDKTLNKVSNSSISQKQAKYAPSTIKHLLGCRPTRQQALRLQCLNTQKSRCIAATAFIILINPTLQWKFFQKISRGMSQSEDMHILNYGRRIRHRYV